MKVQIRGRGDIIELTKKDFINSGGEGDVYGVGNLAYKIFKNPIAVLPESKLKELSCLDKDEIIRPLHIILRRNKEIGFVMKLVGKDIPLTLLLSNAWKKRNRVDQKLCLEILNNIIETTQFIHSHNCVVADGNDTNYLLEPRDFKKVYFIDVSNYQTPSYKAIFVRPDIRDFSCKEFTPLTDWFSFGILCCRILLGCHPFKGNHNIYGNNMFERMKKVGASIFNKQCTTPANCKDFSSIPNEYLLWFINIFDNGKRLPPPQVIPCIGKRIQTEVRSGKLFEVTFLKEFESDVLAYLNIFGLDIVKTTSCIHINDKIFKYYDKYTEIVVEPVSLNKVMVYVKEDGELVLFNLDTSHQIMTDIKCSSFWIQDNNIIVLRENKLCILEITQVFGKIICKVVSVLEVMKFSTMFSKFLYQNIFAKSYISYVIDGRFVTIHIDQLDGHTIITGSIKRNVLIAISRKGGDLIENIIIFEDSTYDIQQQKISEIDINFVVLDNGIVIMNKGGDIILTKNKIGSKKYVMKDSNISIDMLLSNFENEARIIVDNKLYKLAMVKTN